MKKYLTLLLSGMSLIGCASSDDLSLKQNTLPLETELCCESVSQYPWVRLQQNQELDFQLNSASPVGLFEQEKSYFSAFTFAQQSGSVELRLRSLMLDGEVAVPQIELLDENFNVVKTIDDTEFEIKFSDALAKNRYELTMTVDTVFSPYMIVYVETSELGKKVVVPHPAKLRAEESGEPMPIVTDPTYLASNNGHFSLNIETQTLSGYNQKSLIQSEPETSIAKTKAKSIVVVPETQTYYHNAIRTAVESNNLDKALSLLEEAKALNVEGAQQVFIKAVNAK
ncbi:MalM family protein [Vibrio sp. M260118]|uniref:MalM family protein n=1 Tax=Vibrio sp. M260118 TaxID=3020896 RepID=UPI002F3FB978